MGNIRKRFSCIFLVIMLVCLTACNKGEAGNNSGNAGEKGSEGVNAGNISEDNTNNTANVAYTPIKMSDDFKADKEELALYESLFSSDSKIKVTVDISDEELRKIQEDYDRYSSKGSKSPIYRKCNMTFEINGEKYTIEEVGVRMKGNTSRTDFYNENSMSVYALIHFKFSFTQTFDNEEYYGEDAKVWASEEERQARKDRTFATLEGIEMKWNHDLDSTYTREIYAYEMYRDMGVLAPNCVLSQLVISGESYGVYKIYEPVDKVFIKRYFDKQDRDGDLYKCTWGSGPANYTNASNTVGIKDEDKKRFYTYDLKTNKKTSTHENIKNLISVINKSGVTKEELEAVVDIDNWLRFEAVSYFLGMPDDLRNNYNNHYVYFRSSDNKAVFIAYDCEICMGINSWNPTGEYMTKSDPYSSKAYGANGNQENKLIVKTITNSGFYKDEYTKMLDAVAQSKWMDYSNFAERYRKNYVHYAGRVGVDIELKNMKEQWLTMSEDDTFEEDGNIGQIGNMTVKDFMSKILGNYNSTN